MRIIAKRECSSHRNENTYIISVSTKAQISTAYQITRLDNVPSHSQLATVGDSSETISKPTGNRYRGRMIPNFCYHQGKAHIDLTQARILARFGYLKALPHPKSRHPSLTMCHSTDTHRQSTEMPCHHLKDGFTGLKPKPKPTTTKGEAQ